MFDGNSAVDITLSPDAGGARNSSLSFYYVLEFGLSAQYHLTRQDLHSGGRTGLAEERGLAAGRDYIHLIWSVSQTVAIAIIWICYNIM
jgi:hypothetical protein